MMRTGLRWESRHWPSPAGQVGPSRTAELSRFSDPPAAGGVPSVWSPNACSNIFVPKSAGEIFFIDSLAMPS